MEDLNPGARAIMILMILLDIQVNISLNLKPQLKLPVTQADACQIPEGSSGNAMMLTRAPQVKSMSRW